MIKTHSLSFSDLSVSHFQALIDQLQEQRLELLDKIKKKQNQLERFYQHRELFAVDINQHLQPILQNIDRLDHEIHHLFQQILSQRNLSEKKYQKILSIYHQLQEFGFIDNRIPAKNSVGSSPTNELEQLDNQPVEYRREIPIRQKFLQLAAIFHPDKALNPETRQAYTEIMKEINHAYQESSLVKLLDIEAKYKDLFRESQRTTFGRDIKQQYLDLRKECSFLKKQYHQLKIEWRSQTETPEGKTIKRYQSLKKKNIDPMESIMVDAKIRKQQLQDIRDFVKAFHEGKISWKTFLQEPSSPLPKTLSKWVKNLFGISLGFEF